ALAGVATYMQMPRAEDPGFTVRTAVVVTHFPGASAERVEQLVTDKLEKRIQEMPELKHVRSTSKTGISIIEVEVEAKFRKEKIRPVWDKLRRKVTDATAELPDGVVGPFVNDEFGDVFGIVIGLTGDGYNYAELKDIADDVRDSLLELPQTAKIQIFGSQEERVFVEFRLERLAELGLSPGQLRQLMMTQNIVASGGSVELHGKRFVLEPSGNFESVEDIENTLVRLPETKETLRLGDIATVSRGYVDPPTSFFHQSGTPGISLAISMKEGGNILSHGDLVMERIRLLEEYYPWGVQFEIVNFQPEDVSNTIKGFTSSLLQSVIVVLLSMLLFLGLRTGLVVASLIPTAIAATMVCMSLLGMGLDKVSLAALVIALGLLVDNAVVMSEATLVRMEQGIAPVKAAIDSATELKAPLFISSLTTIAAFMPLPLAANDMGEFLGPLGIILAITLIASWLLSITAIPWLCSLFLKVKKSEADAPVDEDAVYNSRFYRIYRGILLRVLRFPVLTVTGVALLFGSSLYTLGKVPKVYMSESNLPSFTVELAGVQGQDILYTQKMTQEIEQWLEDTYLVTEEEAAEGKEGIIKWASYIGNGGPRFYLSFQPEDPSPEYAIIIPTATSGSEAKRLIPEIRNYITANYPDINPIVKLRSSGGGAPAPLGYEIMGPDTEMIFSIVEELKSKLGAIPGVVNIRDDWGEKNAKVIVDIDDNRLKRAGLTNQDVATSLTAAFDGFEVTEYREDDKVIPTLIRAKGISEDGQRRVGAMTVFSEQSGISVPLGQVAQLAAHYEPPLIRRKDKVRKVEVRANITEAITANAANVQIMPWLEEEAKTWPPGFKFHVTGDAESSAESNGAIGEKLPAAGFLIIMLLVLQFNSIRQSAIVLLTIPLSIIGVAYGLLFTNSYFGFMAFLGVLSLAGVVINNAIVLIDRIKIELQEGATPQDAIIQSAQKRLRPILLTTGSTVLGLLPLWFGDDPMWVPMAISLIFGLLFATVLTLGFVPVLYAIFYRVSFKKLKTA
ncbi:MAG: efflux RND transporter permease subunit, partial [Polyangiaceae bacterium]|nr:efflux RND transporter permease subunit [Polyangiaceae bacterium]